MHTSRFAMTPSGPLASIREFFVLGSAQRTVAAYTTTQHGRVHAHAEAAAARLAAGRRTLHDVPAAVLLLDGVRHYLRAGLAAKSALDAGDEEGADLAPAMPPLPPDPARPTAVPTDEERVRAALSSTDGLYLDRLSPEDVARTRVALDRAGSLLAGRVEARSLLNVRATRWGRLAALAFSILYGLGAIASAVLLPRNVARDKPVHPSSSRHGDGHELVDGDLATVPGVFTNVEESPSVTIDLVDTYALDEVRVHNRLDQSFDDCLPLAVEVSTDGAAYKLVARREEHFAADPPWVIFAHHEPARFVRVRVMRRGYLALSEVEVFGKKLPPRPPPPRP